MLGSCRRSLALLLVLLGGAALSTPARAAFVQSTCQICQEGPYCETGPFVSIPGQQTDMSRAWDGSGFAYAASCAIATNFAGFSAFARGSGFESPEDPGGTIFINHVGRSGIAYGHFNDTFTAGSGGGTGFLRLPLHLVGNASISWQNGFGVASFSVTCQSYEPGSQFALGNCVLIARNFTTNTGIDEVVNVDVPIILGSPVTYTVSVAVQAGAGHNYGDLIPFAGQAEITLATLPFAGAIVLDASKQPIPGATVSAGESGFVYQAPEAPSLFAAVAALFAIRRIRRR